MCLEQCGFGNGLWGVLMQFGMGNDRLNYTHFDLRTYVLSHPENVLGKCCVVGIFNGRMEYGKCA
jgi:hypothetical protein